jgi:hypothetical protein
MTTEEYAFFLAYGVETEEELILEEILQEF